MSQLDFDEPKQREEKKAKDISKSIGDEEPIFRDRVLKERDKMRYRSSDPEKTDSQREASDKIILLNTESLLKEAEEEKETEKEKEEGDREGEKE